MNQNYLFQNASILNEVKEAVLLVDKEGKIQFYNKEAERIVGDNRQIQINKHILDVIPNSELPRVLKTRSIETGKLFSISNQYFVRISRFPLINKRNQVIGALAIFEDPSDYKEEWDTKANLSESLKTVLQLSEQAMAIIDENGKIILQNNAYQQLKHADIKFEHEGKEVNLRNLLQLLQEKAVDTRRHFEYKVENMDIRCKIDTSPIYADGKLKGSLQLIHQDTEIMKLQNELNHTRSLVRALESQIYFVDIIGTSQLMSMSIQQGKLAAQADHAVFLRGEEGTGKDMFASAIHNEGKQRYHQFKVINCLNTNKEELEAFFNEGRGRKDSELTGQNELRGTLYLDEISYLPLDLQKQLHKCLLNTQQRTDSASPFLGMRIIASSSINVEKAMMNGEFLEELYYDLIKGSIYLPSLKEHKEDILPIATTFIDQLNQRYGRKVKKMSEEALQNLGNYSFPGNVRELKAMIEVAMVRMTKKDELLVAEHFCFAQTSLIKKAKMDIPEVQQDQPLSLLVEGYEKIIIEQTLTKLEGNKTLTAKKLGLSVRNLYYKLEKYHLN